MVQDLEKLYNKKNEVFKVRYEYNKKIAKLGRDILVKEWQVGKLVEMKHQLSDGLMKVYDMINNDVDKEVIKKEIMESLDTDKIVHPSLKRKDENE